MTESGCVMKLRCRWLREFVGRHVLAEEIAEKLALRGFEVAAVEALAGGDAVIDFEVTANRPDCLSVLGLAREVATAFELPLVAPSHDASAAVPLTRLAAGHSERSTVTHRGRGALPALRRAPSPRSRIGPSPAWMADRLQAAGVRPINNIVDITNYVLLELGQPMHAFDSARLAGAQIRVRRARPGETLTTLDGVDAQAGRRHARHRRSRSPQAVAGVMGGADSEVSAGTTTIVVRKRLLSTPDRFAGPARAWV